MSFCTNCGSPILDGTKFCQNCGVDVNAGQAAERAKRQKEYIGRVIKCPVCGENIPSFTVVCPSCGHEFRGAKASGVIKEFASKLEAIEYGREYEKPRVLFGVFDNKVRVSKTDEQKISLIQSFAVPNTKEDILEFMILATSNINFRSYDSTNTNISKSNIAINDAWLAKIRQVYSKAKLSYSNDFDFSQIQKLYDDCIINIGKSKKKGIFKWVLVFGWMPLLFAVLFIMIAIKAPDAAHKENDRLVSIEQTAIDSLENKEYEEALLNAEDLVYKPSFRNNESDEIERQWDVKRETLINKIIATAKADGIDLEYVPEESNSN